METTGVQVSNGSRVKPAGKARRLGARVAAIAADLSRDLGFREQTKTSTVPRNGSKRVRS